MRIPSAVTDQFIYFVAVDSVDLKTRETGLATWTVYRSRDGAVAAAFTTPTINETDVTNMPGVYELLLDEDMTIAAGNDSEEFCVHITHAGMAPVTRVFELYRPKFTAGSTLAVTDIVSAGAITTLSGAVVNVDLTDTITTYTGNTVQTGDSFARLGAPAGASVSVDIAAIEAQTDDIGVAGAGLTNIGTIATVTTLTNLPAITANWLTAAGTAADFGTEVAAAVWNEDATGHQTTGTFGQAIGDPVADTNTIYKAVVTDAAGATVGVDVVAVKAETASIQTDTNDLQTQIGTAGAGLTAADDAVMTRLGAPAGASVSADVAAVKVDTAAILVDTGTTLQGELDAIEAAVITNAAGVDIAADIIAMKADTAAILVDTGTTLDGRIPDALTAGGNMKSDALAISGSTESADRLERSTLAIVTGTCAAGGATTTIIASALSPTSAVNSQFNGRIVTFDKDTTTAALRGQATDITGYVHATLTFTVTALTTAPASGDTFTVT